MDVSRLPSTNAPRPPLPGAPICGSPELVVAWKSVAPLFMRPCGLENSAVAIWPTLWLWPLENVADTVPSAPIVKPRRVPDANPS